MGLIGSDGYLDELNAPGPTLKAYHATLLTRPSEAVQRLLRGNSGRSLLGRPSCRDCPCGRMQDLKRYALVPQQPLGFDPSDRIRRHLLQQ
jgi:hypothetical protein